MKKRNSGLVYSTELGRTCPVCRQSLAHCRCATSAAVRGDGRVRVMRDSKRRGGKTVTVITGVPLDDAGLRMLAGDLKRRCGSGGTVVGGAIEVQGDHRDVVLRELIARGYDAKLAGG